MATEQRPVEALARGLRILEVLSRTTGSLGNGQLARRTGLAPSTVSRLTDSLVQLGYLRVDPASGAYVLTPKNLRLGYPVLVNLPLGGRAYRALDRLTQTTGMTSAIAVRDDLHVTYLSAARSRRPGSVVLAVGGRLPLAQSAAGIAYLRAMDEPQRSRTLDRVRRDLEKRGRPAAAFERLLADHSTPYVLSVGNWHEDVGGVATGFRTAGELYAITLIARTEELELADIAGDLAPALLDAASDIAD